MLPRWLLLCLLLVPWFVRAAEPLSLATVVARVLQTHPEVALQEARLQRAKAIHQQSEGAFDWTVSAAAAYRRPRIPESRNGYLTTDTTTAEVYDLTLGLSRQLRNGITLTPSLYLAHNLDESNSDALAQAVPFGNLGLTIPLLRGAGEEAVTADAQAAGEAVSASRLQGERAIAELLERTVEVYWNCRSAEDSVDALQEVVTEAAAYTDTVKALVGQGEMAVNQYRRSFADLTLRRIKLNQARAVALAARQELASLLGEQGGGTPPQTADPFPVPSAALPSEQALVDLALRNRRDLQALDHQRRAETLRLDKARNELLPKLDFRLDFDKVSLNLTQSLGNNAGKGAVGSHMAAGVALDMEKRQLERTIRAGVAETLNSMQAAREDRAQADEAVQMLRQVVADLRKRVGRGEGARADFVAALDQLVQTRAALNQASQQYAVDLAQLRVVTGTMPTGVDSKGLVNALLTPPTP